MSGLLRKGYMSDIDIFLREFDKNHPDYGESKKKEIEKHKRIAQKRDIESEKTKT